MYSEKRKEEKRREEKRREEKRREEKRREEKRRDERRRDEMKWSKIFTCSSSKDVGTECGHQVCRKLYGQV